MQTQQPQHATISLTQMHNHYTHTHTHICPPTQINTNNDEGGIQRLGITVRKCEILHPHNKICFHTTKHVIDSQKHEIFHRHKKYVTKRTRNFSSTHSSTNYCAVPRTVLNHTLTGDSLLRGPPLLWNSGRARARRAGRDPPELVWRTATG
jgi:hypothetical protein